MRVPDCDTCRRLLEEYRVPPHIVAHSRQVAAIGVALGEALAGAGLEFDRQLLLSAGLLHDIAKMASLENGRDHAELGGEWLEREGYPEVAEIVRCHVRLPAAAAGPPDAREVIFYADKRVRHDEIVSLPERFADLKQRYRKWFSDDDWIGGMELFSLALEQRIFALLDFDPLAVAERAAAIKIC
jgi:putative nucleotidyltransferase with HDIG domain